MDIFSNQRSFFIKGHPVYYTSIGGCFTLIIFSLALLFFYYLALLSLKDDYSLINKFQTFNDDTLTWETSAKIIISYPKSIENKVMFFRDYSYKQELETFHNCSNQEYSMYYDNPKNSSHHYKCGNIMAPGYYDHTLYAVNCSYFKKHNLFINNIDCEEDSILEEFNFEYFIYSERYNTKTHQGKISKYILKNPDLNETNNMKVFFNFNKLVEYDYFDEISEINYFTDIVNVAPSSGSSEVIFSIEATKDDGNLSYLSNMQIEVKKIKVQQMLAMVIVIFNILFTICFYINNIINDFQLRKYILSLLIENIDFMISFNEIKEEMQKNKKIQLRLPTNEFIIKLYTFKNYIRFQFNLCLSNETKNVLKIINEKITQKMSIETLQGKNFDFNNDGNNNNSSIFWRKISSFFECCDFLAPGIAFTIKHHKTFSTLPGKIFTFLYLIGLALLFYFFGASFWYKFPRLSQMQADNYSNKQFFNYDIPVMIYFPKEILPYHNITYYDRIQAQVGLTNFSVCEPFEFEKFGKFPNENYSYWCNNVKYYFPNTTDDAYISLMRCNQLIDAGFNETGCIQYDFGENSKNFTNVIIGVVFLSKSINLHESDLHTKDIIYERNHTLPFDAPRNTMEYDFHFAQQEINNCQGAFSCNYENYHFGTFYNSSVFYYGSDLDSTADFYFRFHIHLIWTRDYTKIYEMLAQVMSLGKILWLCMYLCNLFLENYFFFKLFKSEFLQKHLQFHKLPNKTQQDFKILFSKGYAIEPKSSELMLSSASTTNALKIDMRNFIKKKVITFRNYMIYKLFGPILNPKLFNIYACIYKEMVLCSSFESTLRVNLKTKESKIEKFLSYFDYLSENRLIHYKKSNKYTTWIGGVFSLIKLALIIFFVIIFGFDFWYKKNPRFLSYTAKYYEMNPEDFSMSIPIMIYYEKNFSDYLLISNEDFAGDKKFKKNFGMWDCTKNDSIFFDIPLALNKIYKCSNVNQVLNFNYVNLGSIEGNYRLIDCYHAQRGGDKECNSSLPSEYFKLPEEAIVYVGYKFNITKFNQDDSFNPVYSEWIEIDENYSNFNLPKAEYDIRNSMLIDDPGWIVPSPITYKYTSLMNIKIKPHRGSGMLVAFTFVTPDVMIIRRQYMRLAELLANVFAMVNLINGVLVFVYFNLNNYFFYCELGKNVKRKNSNENTPRIGFINFVLGHTFKITHWNRNYVKLSNHYEEIFSFEKILFQEIDRRFSKANRVSRKSNILGDGLIQMKECVRKKVDGNNLNAIFPKKTLNEIKKK